MNKVKAYTWREGEIIMFFKMEYKYIHKILEKIWKMYHIQNGVIGQNYQIELLIYELSAKSKGDILLSSLVMMKHNCSNKGFN